jgi:hypothetical protein
MNAIAYLRRRTVWRSAHGYAVWVGRAVGWWTIVYLIFWVVVFAIAGVETLVRLSEPLPSAIPLALGSAVAAAFALLVVAGRAPPVVVDRRDLYHLALAPTTPYEVLRLRLDARRVLRLALGAVIGAAWSVVAPPLFHLQAPWAAPALALLAMAHADVTWLRYAGFRRRDDDGRAARMAARVWTVVAVATGGVAAALVGVDAPWSSWAAAIGLTSALTRPEPWTLVVPLVLAVMAQRAVRRSLARSWPPRFAAQSLVLTQLQAMRTLQVLAGVAGMSASLRELDAGERERLLAALHDRPGATRPRRSLRPPVLGSAPWRAIAWRAASTLVRRPRGAQVRLALLAVAAVAAIFCAADALLGPPPVVAGAPGTPTEVPADTLGAAFVGAIAVLSAAWLLARTAAGLLGPPLPGAALPIDATERTRGRLTPAGLVLAVAAVPALGALSLLASRFGSGSVLGPDPVGLFAAAVVLAATVLVALEKYATWSGAVARGWEATLVAALVAALPALVLGMFGVPGWTLPTQVALLVVLWWLPV